MIWDILLLKAYFTAVAYPKFRCNRVSFIVSDDPTREQPETLSIITVATDQRIGQNQPCLVQRSQSWTLVTTPYPGPGPGGEDGTVTTGGLCPQEILRRTAALSAQAAVSKTPDRVA